MEQRRDAVVHYTAADGKRGTWRIATREDDDEESVRAHARRYRPSIVVDRVTFDNGTPPPEEEQQTMSSSSINDISQPSEAARKELDDPQYLGSCYATASTCIRDATVTYDVRVGGWYVWSREVQFGDDKAHRAAGAAFVGVAREQERVLHEWADRILAARAQVQA